MNTVKTEYEIKIPYISHKDSTQNSQNQCESFQNKPLTLAVVADLHEQSPDEIIEILKNDAPDYILVPGDTFERYENRADRDFGDTSFLSRTLCHVMHYFEKVFGDYKTRHPEVNIENSYRFLREASKIAPVYMSIGNHEQFFTEEDMAVINECGVVVLDNEYVEIVTKTENKKEITLDLEPENIEDTKIELEQENKEEIKLESELMRFYIGGLTSRRWGASGEDFLKEYSNCTTYKILLSHHPEYFDFLKNYDFDLILSGHCHGGQIRLFGQGIFAPGQGLFPRYHHGVYSSAGKPIMIVSSGVSNTTFIPRLGNPKEVVYVKIT